MVAALVDESKGFAPAADALTRRTVDAAFAEALSPAHEAALKRFTTSIVSSAMSSAAEELPTTMAPAMRKALVEHLGRGFAEVIRSPDVKGALVETTNDVARQAVLGSNEGLALLDEKRRHDQGGMPLGVFGAFFAARPWLIVLFVSVVVFMFPIVWLLRDRRRLRLQWHDTERRHSRADALLTAIQASADEGASSRIVGELRRELHEGGGTSPHHA